MPLDKSGKKPTKPIPVLLQRVSWPLKVVIVLGLALLALGVITMLAQVFGIRVLASEDWVMRARPFAVGLGVVSAVGLAVLVWLGFKVQGERKTVKNWLVQVFSVAMGFWLGTALVYTGPALLGSAGQTQVTHIFTVREVARVSDRRCRDAVKLAGLPFMSNEICGVPDGMRARLAPGMRIEVTGTGNALGLRPARIRPVP